MNPDRAAKSAAAKKKPRQAAKSATVRRAKPSAAADAPSAQVVSIPERMVPTPLPRRRSNRRSEQTVANILACTERVVLESGAERISILDVCRAAQVSRGTFYRYFASQDELLEAFSRHKRDRFHRRLLEIVAPLPDPDERFAAVIVYLDNYLEQGQARRLLLVAPEYALGFFRRIFHDSFVRFQDVLGIVFDAWEERLSIQVDRELISEMLIRYVLSELLVPSDGDRKSIPRRIGRMIEALVARAPARARR
jgi:AcrR family transcriptional regulator